MKKESHFTIRQFAESDRPREKMLSHGPQFLTDAELLALIIGSGNPGETAIQLMQRLLATVDHRVTELHQLSVAKLTQWKGIGPAKAVKIKACLELSKRMSLQATQQKTECSSSRSAFELFRPVLSYLPHEEFWGLYLNQRNHVIHRQCLSKGGLINTAIDVRLVLRVALEHRATAIIVAHNHPTGNLLPSRADELITQKLHKAAQMMDIKLLDHLIIGEKTYFSFADEKRL